MKKKMQRKFKRRGYTFPRRHLLSPLAYPAPRMMPTTLSSPSPPTSPATKEKEEAGGGCMSSRRGGKLERERDG